MTDVLTTHRDLRTGRTIWQDGPQSQVPMQAPQGTIKADVLVVGAGLTGALMADVLSEAGLKVVMAERRKPLAGSAMATTALIQFELDTPLLHLGEKIGDRSAQRVWLRSKRAVDSLKSRAGSIDCQWCDRSTLYLAGSLLSGKALRDEAYAREDIGLPSTLKSGNALLEHYGIEADGAIRSSGNAECNPVMLGSGLLRRALSRGARVYGPVEISEFEEDTDSVTAKSKEGVTFRCEAMIYAAGYEIPDIVPQKGKRIASTWAIATAPQPENLWPSRAMIWEAAEPYLYVRTTQDGRVIAGGEDEDFSDAKSRDALIPKKTAAIQRKLKHLFPQLDVEADYAWTGSFGASDTGMPSIGLVPGRARTYAVLGFGGNGITFGMIAAETLCGALMGKPDPDAPLFAFK
ncbi:MAG: FAD-binding oxidoreductase [Pseudolabrys sp.]|nr:FAD-binding oxidoreductase [Pseudolabrys sp.]